MIQRVGLLFELMEEMGYEEEMRSVMVILLLMVKLMQKETLGFLICC